MVKCEKMVCLEGNRQKIMPLVVLIIIALLVNLSSVSAAEFDNTKSYDSITKTVTIKNAFGLGETIAEVKLKTPINFLVPRGYNKVAEFEVRSYQDYSNALKELELYDKNKGMNKFLRDYDYKVLSYENVTTYEYYNNCSGTICYEPITETRIEQKEVWTKLTPADFKKSDVLTIGIFTNVEKGDSVEWIPNFFGIRVNEWATWSEALSVGLVSYYSLNETSYPVLDSKGINNGTNFSAVPITSGKLAGAYNFTRGASQYINLGNHSSLAITGDLTVSLWFRAVGDYISNFNTLIGNNDGGSNPTAYSIAMGVPDNEFKFSQGTADVATSSVNLNDNNWHHLVVIRNGSAGAWEIQWYWDGVKDQSNFTATNPTAPGVANTSLGRMGSYNAHYLNGTLDEVGIWNRSLTAAEITDLYNGGAGLPYSSSGAGTTTITINYPANGQIYQNVKDLNYTIVNSGNNITGCWYSTNGGQSNTTITCGNNVTGITGIGWGSNTFLVGLNTSTGLNYSTTSTFTKQSQFAFCNTTLTTKYLNISFKDADTSSIINASISSSNFTYYYLGQDTSNSTYSFINNTPNFNYNFCYLPSYANITVFGTVSYGNDGYLSSSGTMNTTILGNSTVAQQVFYLVSNLNGNYFTFQVIDTNNEGIANVYVTASRLVSGVLTEISTGYTDSAGVVTFWLNPDYVHTFTFSKSGYTTQSYNIYPIAANSPYTVDFGGTTTVHINDTFSGKTVIVKPSTSTTLINNTNYEFNFTINDSYSTLTSYGFYLRNSSSYLGKVTGTTAGGSTIRITNNTLNYTTIYMDWYFVSTNGTAYNNNTIIWYVESLEGYRFSLKHFFEDLNTYTTETGTTKGIFGITPLARTLIVFFFIVLITGMIGYSVGFENKGIMIAVASGLLILIDQVGLLKLNGDSGIVTTVVLMVVAILIVMEVASR